MTPHSSHADGFTALKSGTVIERYRIESVIAAGGFGITYLCRHATLDKLYALKEHFPRQFAYRESATSQVRSTDSQTFSWALDRFLQEGRTLAKCAHPGIVSVADVFEANNTAYMVLDYERGSNFKDWLAALGRPPTQDEIDTVLEPLLDALEYVHAQGMLHRDIAPDNIVIRADGSPCLIDFGSARQAVAERSEMMSAIVKSGFSPLEQYASSGKAQGPWSDIYALAATLYRAISGKTPTEAIERQIDDEPLQLAQAIENPQDYRQSFLDGIDQALHLRPGERPQSVSQWRAVFKGATDGTSPLPIGRTVPQTKPRGPSEEDLQSGPTQSASKTRISEPRSSSVAVWIAAIFVALAIGAGGYAYRATPLNQAPPTKAVPPGDTREAAIQAAPAPARTTASREAAPGAGSAPIPPVAVEATKPVREAKQKPEGAVTSAASAPRPAIEKLSDAAPRISPPDPASERPPDAAVAAPPPPQQRSIAEFIAGVPAVSPIEGLGESAWKQSCPACHKWTQESLCKQGQTYAQAPEKINRHPHPFGGEFKTRLKTWAEGGCT